MLKIAGLIAVGCLLAAPTSASPLMQTGNIAQASAYSDDVVLIKSKAKARPYGWSKGRKVGWRGGSVPPGHQKKRVR
jgi:hypothetical protein